MRVLLQRVESASVEMDSRTVGEIGEGFLLLVGVNADDADNEVDTLVEKVSNLRVFEDADGKMNLSALDRVAAGVDTGMLVVSQFTLYGDVRKGRRPSFSDAAPPTIAQPLIAQFAERLAAKGFLTGQGEFGAHMKVSLVNDGPVTIWIDTEELRQPRRSQHE